jgi:hypothetical protein
VLNKLQHLELLISSLDGFKGSKFIFEEGPDGGIFQLDLVQLDLDSALTVITNWFLQPQKVADFDLNL